MELVVALSQKAKDSERIKGKERRRTHEKDIQKYRKVKSAETKGGGRDRTENSKRHKATDVESVNNWDDEREGVKGVPTSSGIPLQLPV